MGYFLVPNLATLRAEINARWPGRDKTSDGWIGDQAHATRPSGHNPDESGNAERRDADNLDEVRALDLDRDIDAAPGDELFTILDRIRRTPALRRRLIYIIYRSKIASASNGWTWQPYYGDNPHTEHGHLSGHPDHDDNTDPWGVDDMAELTTDQARQLRRADVYGYALVTGAEETLEVPDHTGTLVSYPVVPNVRIRQLTEKVDALTAKLNALAARPAADVDEAALAQALAPLLQPGVTLEQLRDVLASVRLVPQG